MLMAVGGCDIFPTADSTSEQQQQAAAAEANSAITAEAKVAGSSSDSHAISDLVGGSLGAGGGFLIGIPQQNAKLDDAAKLRDGAIDASRRAERNPVKVEVADTTESADLNADGFLTTDEIVAMRQAHLSDREIMDRLVRSDFRFQITAFQETYLRDRGVGDAVIRGMRAMSRDNAGDTAQLASERQKAPSTQQTKEGAASDKHF
jgi:hypothetical protein